MSKKMYFLWLSGSERRIRIREILKEQGEVSVADLAERFGVNAMTIRRDLHQFEDQGILEMHYGGARLRQTKPPFEEFARREEIHRAKKRAIAKAAAALIREGDVLFLDVSTTVLSVIDYLPDIRLTIVTNSLPAVVALSGRQKIRLISCPGMYQSLYGGLMDLTTVEFLRRYHFQKAFLGASFCEPDFGVSCDEEIEAAIKRTVLAQSDHTWLLIDDSKMKGHTFIKISDVSAYDSILTNVSLDQNLQSDYKEKGARLTLC